MIQEDWMDSPPETLKEKVALLKDKRCLLQSPGKKGQFLRAILRDVEREWAEIEEAARQEEPLAFFLPSYEQALLLNAWMYGISFLCVYSANRIGKTTACWINFLLWIIPNDPRWLIFQPYTDHLGRHVQVYPRPDIAALKLISDYQNAQSKLAPADFPIPNPRLPVDAPVNEQFLQLLQKAIPFAYAPTYPFAPWNRNGTMWFGAPDQDHHEKVIMPLFRQYIPARFLTRYVTTDRGITLSITTPTNRETTWELIGKSYESKDTKWSSGAVDAILVTEGLKQDTLKEIKARFKDPGIGSHDFTPYLPANGGQASFVAQRIAQGREPLPLRYAVFTKFSVYDAPPHIISPDKRAGLIASYKDDPEGRARLDGDFYSSSELILSHLSRDLHLLPWSTKELFRRYPNARIYRGLDPGLDHPCACAWAALLPTNDWVFYRIFSERGLSIQARIERIVSLSHNSLSKVKYGSSASDYYQVECHPTPRSEIAVATVCDFHTFKTDEVTGTAYANNYISRGLAIIESVHTGPEQRAQTLDDLLAPSQFHAHLLSQRPPGPKVYFLKNEPGILQAFNIWEELYWDRKKSGPNKGMPNDKVPEHGDNELDAVCYLTSGPFRWTNYRPPARLPNDSEPEDHLIERSLHNNDRQSTARLQALQNASRSPKVPDEPVFFGGNPYEEAALEEEANERDIR